MPSGSHGGSRGSHGSGGSSFGGSSGGGFRGGHGGFGGGFRRSPFFRTIIISRGIRTAVPQKYSGLSFFASLLVMAAFFMTFFGVILTISSSSSLSKIKADYVYYQQMIAEAEADPSLQITGTIIDKFYNEDCKKWYITYEFPHHFEGTIDGYSFSVYTFEEVSKFKIGGDIELAINNPIPDSETDSVPMDYKDMPLSRDGEYVTTLSSQRTGIGLFVVAAVCIIGAILVYVVLRKKTKADYEKEQKEKAEKEKKLRETPRCKYCGNKIAKGQQICPGCGAKTAREAEEIKLKDELLITHAKNSKNQEL